MEIVFGKNAVLNIIEAKKRTIFNCYVSTEKKALEIKAKNYKIVASSFLDKLTKNAKHQGFVLEVSDFIYENINYVRELSKTKDRVKLVTLDKVQDPQNFGQIIRTAECFGIDAIIIPNKATAQITSSVVKASTGASEIVPIVQVANLNKTIIELRKLNIWNVATDGSGNDDINVINKEMSFNLILGSEGNGISRILLENADIVSKISMKGKINSLNVSAACAIFLNSLS